jgi:hypothetical protein
MDFIPPTSGGEISHFTFDLEGTKHGLQTQWDVTTAIIQPPGPDWNPKPTTGV